MNKVYLDYNASTPIAPEVHEAIAPYLAHHFGNPSSLHWASEGAKEALETARRQVADLLHSWPDEIVFTSGGTEANNQAIKGAFFASRDRGNHIITTQIEHPSVINPCRFLERLGAEVTWLPVDETGMVNPDEVRRAITPATILVSVMHANNEVGTIQPIAEISGFTKERGILFHTDAAQSAGKIPTDVATLGIDLLSIAGHKLYAPKGIGTLYIKRGVQLEPLMHGAGHESGRRAGTESLPLVAGLGKACELAAAHLPTGPVEMGRRRDQLYDGMKALFGSRLVLNGHIRHRLPNTLNFSIKGMSGQEFLALLPRLAASTGSACHTGSRTVSPVLKAMNLDESRGLAAVRFSLGRETTDFEIHAVLEMLKLL
jgi:cysteine desulfurase